MPAPLSSRAARRTARPARSIAHPLNLLPVAFAAALVAGSPVAFAQPALNALPVINGGVAPINAAIGTQTGTVNNPIMNITQTGARGVIEWSGFSIGADARVNIQQTNAQSVLVNRVTPGSAPVSQIFGQLNSNGRVFIVNTAGVTFGANAQVNVGSLVATTLDLAPSMTGNNYQGLLDPQTNTFVFQTGFGALQVDSGARLVADPAGGGSIVLLGSSTVAQNGTLDAVRGHIAMSAGGGAQVVLPASTSGFIDLVVTAPVSGTGSIATGGGSLTRAEGGSIVIGGGAASVARAETIQIDGDVEAGSTTGAAGRVRIDAGANGSTTIGPSGGVRAASTAAGQKGGTVELLGNSITLATPLLLSPTPTLVGKVDVGGAAGGGTATIGSDATRAVTIAGGVNIVADATGTGDGGVIDVRANYFDPLSTGPVARFDYGVTEVYGNLYARGGTSGGNGGRIETSGTALTTSLLDTQTTTTSRAAIDARARAAGGTSGTWTIDPFNVTISNAPPVAIGGAFAPTGPGANIDAASITAALNNGSSVDINTGTAGLGNQAGTLTVAPGVSIQRGIAGAPVTLSLRAHGDVTADNATIFAVTGAPVNVRLLSDLDGNGTGSVSLTNNVQITTAGGSVQIGGGLDPASGFATGAGQGAGVNLGFVRINTSSGGAALAGNVTIRGAGGAGTEDNGVTTAGGSEITANDITVYGRSANGLGVLMNDTQLTTTTGNVDIRGVAVRTTSGSKQTVGVEVGNVTIALNNGSLLMAGRGDDGTSPVKGPAAANGLRYDDLEIRAGAASPGSIAFVGEAVNSNAAGIQVVNPTGPSLDIRAGTSGNIPTLANVSFGAISSDGLALAIAQDTSPVATTGTIAFRPAGLSAAGVVTESTGTPILVGPVPTGLPTFLVDPTDLGLGTTFRADRGFVIGSSAHTGAITVTDGSLSGRQAQSYTLQNGGAGSGGIALGTGVQVRDLGLLSAGAVTQSGAVTVARDLVLGGTGGSFTLTQPANSVGGNVAFAGPATVNLLVTGPLAIGNNTGLAQYEAGSASFAPLALTASSAGTASTLRADAAVTVGHAVSSPAVDIVSPVSIDAGAQAAVGGSYFRAWAPVVNGLAGRLNLYGCVYPNCALSGIVPPPTGVQALYPTRPTVNVAADALGGTAGQPLPALTYTTTGLLNGDTAATALTGALATVATATSPEGIYAITQGTLVSPTGYLVAYSPASLTLAAGTVVSPSALAASDAVRSVYLAQYRSDVYGLNLAMPFVCTAASVVRDSVAREVLSDPLASEWGKVRNQPQLSGCLEVSNGGQCAAF